MDAEAGEQLREQMRTWRREHPHATLAEIEAALDARLDPLRARVLEEVLLAPGTAAKSDNGARERPRCPGCGKAAVWDGEQERSLRTVGEEILTLRRGYASCPSCGTGFFPPG